MGTTDGTSPAFGAGSLGAIAGIGSRARSLLTFRPLVYGYSNARVRTMRTGLLSARQAEDLIAVRTNAGVVEYLSKTGYRDDFANLPMKMADEERLEIAIGRNFARTARKVFAITPDQSKPALRAFLGRYDVHNLKAVLLAKKLGKGADEVRNLLIPAGSMDERELGKLLAAQGPDELYRAIRSTGFGASFLSSSTLRHLPRDRVNAAMRNSDPGFARLELLLVALDGYYYEVASSAMRSIAEKDSDIVLGLLRGEADAKNAVTIMRLKKSSADRKTVMENLVWGGGFSRTQLEKMADARDVPEAARIASSFFTSEVGRTAFKEATELYMQDGQLSHFEVAFENSIARHSLRALRRSMMSIGAIVGFLLLKEEEMNNIRKIARGKALGLPAKKISEMLVLVG